MMAMRPGWWEPGRRVRLGELGEVCAGRGGVLGEVVDRAGRKQTRSSVGRGPI